MIEPSVRKYPVQTEGPDLVLTMPAAGNKALPAFWALYGIAFAGMFVAVSLGMQDGPPLPLAVFFLLMGAAFLAFGVYGLFGRETVRVGSGSIAITRRVFGIPMSSRDYPLPGVTDLRYSPDVYNPTDWNASWLRMFGARRIGFDTGGKTVRFAAAVDEAEARAIIRDIKRRFPVPGVPE
jgi:hypothetical protein